MKPAITFGTLALATTLGVATVAFTHGGPPIEGAWFGEACGLSGSPADGHGGRGGPQREPFEQVGLSDAQREKLAELREQRMKTEIPIQADLRLAHLDLSKLMRADKPDLDAVSRQVDRIATLRASLMKNQLAGLIEARAVLTSAQQKKLKELREQGPRRRMRGERQG